MTVAGIAVLIAVGIGAYLWVNRDPYAGLVKTMEVQSDEATKTLVRQRLATTQAAIVAAQQAGEEVNLDLYVSLASDSLLLGDLVSAREALEKQLEGNALNYTAWNTYGTVLEYMHDYEKALEAYYRALELQPNEEYYRDVITLIEKQFTDRDEQIEILYTDSVKTLGQNVWNMKGLGAWYAAHGDCEKADDHYDVAISLAENADIKVQLKTEAQEAKKACKASDSHQAPLER